MAYSYQPLPPPLAPGPMLTVPNVVVGPQYCAPYPVDLAVVKKLITIADGFTVTDINDNIVFKLKGSVLTLRDRRVLLDAAGYPIVTLRRKLISIHDRWEAFRGESTDSRNLIFTLKRSHLLQPVKTKLDVFLANNTREDVCDFKVKGSWFERSCVVYAGESNNIVARMHKEYTVGSIVLDKDHFTVTIYPNNDYAFIVALIVVLAEINEDDD